MHFNKEDLTENFYKWGSINHDVYTGNPSRRLFNRFNGDQVLFIINYFSDSGNIDLRDCRKLEKLIIHELPLEAKSEISVYNWLRDLSSTQPD